jgi:hypothetical protein
VRKCSYQSRTTLLGSAPVGYDMQATGDFAADDPGGGGSRDGEQRRSPEDEVPPRRRDPWMEAPDYGECDDL